MTKRASTAQLLITKSMASPAVIVLAFSISSLSSSGESSKWKLPSDGDFKQMSLNACFSTRKRATALFPLHNEPVIPTTSMFFGSEGAEVDSSR